MTAIPEYNHPTVKVERHLKVCGFKAQPSRPPKPKNRKKRLTTEQKRFVAQQITDREVANQLRYILNED